MGIFTSIAASPFNGTEDHAQRQAALAAAGVDGGGVDARALDVSRSLQRSVKWELIACYSEKVTQIGLK